MYITHRDYAEESGDFLRLCNFFTANHAYLRSHSCWCLGRIVDWKHALYPLKRSYISFTRQNAHLWFDAFGDLAGFCVSESGDAGIAVLTLPGYRFLYEEMAAWALAYWSGRGSFSTEITEHQDIEARALERLGFHKTADFFARRFNLTGDLVPRCPLEEGFSFVDMAAHPDYRAQAHLRADAFQGKSSLTEEEMNERLRFFNNHQTDPIYHPSTDLCVMAPGGQFVAGCEALIDARSAEADIERVCTHSQFRRRGFARAVIQECLYRLKDMGMRSAYIAGYSEAAIALYGSLGAVDEVKMYVYEQPAPPSA